MDEGICPILVSSSITVSISLVQERCGVSPWPTTTVGPSAWRGASRNADTTHQEGYLGIHDGPNSGMCRICAMQARPSQKLNGLRTTLSG